MALPEDSVIGSFNIYYLSYKISYCYHYFIPCAAVRHIWLIYFSMKQIDKLTYDTFSATWRKQKPVFPQRGFEKLEFLMYFFGFAKLYMISSSGLDLQEQPALYFVEFFFKKSYKTTNWEQFHRIGVEGCHLHWIKRISFCPNERIRQENNTYKAFLLQSLSDFFLFWSDWNRSE